MGCSRHVGVSVRPSVGRDRFAEYEWLRFSLLDKVIETGEHRLPFVIVTIGWSS